MRIIIRKRKKKTYFKDFESEIEEKNMKNIVNFFFFITVFHSIPFGFNLTLMGSCNNSNHNNNTDRAADNINNNERTYQLVDFVNPVSPTVKIE